MGCCLSERDAEKFPDSSKKSPNHVARKIFEKSAEPSRATQPKKQDTFSKSSSERKLVVSTQSDAGRPTGLENLGSTCYMNATLQCLARSPNFLLRLEDSSDSLLSALAELLYAYRTKRDLLAELQAFRSELGRKLPKYCGSKQEDAKDFLLELMAYIERTHRPAADLFYGRRLDKITCLKCGDQVTIEAELFLIPIERQRAPDVTSYLLRAQDDEFKLTGDNKLKCVVCSAQSDASVASKIVRGPQVLIVYIEPFDMQGKRLKSSVSYSERLSLLGRTYALFAVLCHHGSSIHSGHFTAKVKYQEWFLCDDAYVTRLSELSNTEAYFLFYECIDAD